MNVTLALLADSANVSQEGKLNLLGIFNVLYAHTFPAMHPQLQLVLNFEATNAEAGRQKTVDIEFRDADGHKMGSMTGKLVVPRAEAGHPVRINHILPISGLRFEKPGDYEFHIFINEDDKATVSLRVIPTPLKQRD